MTGKVLYKDYVHTASNQMLVAELLELGVVEEERELLVSSCKFCRSALLPMSQYPSTLITTVSVAGLSVPTHIPVSFNILIRDLLGSHAIDGALIDKATACINKGNYLFVKGEDSLGSRLHFVAGYWAERKSSGAYYTPEKVVNELIDRLYEHGW